jgi:hypothetical protein
MEDVGVFYGRAVYFTAIQRILWSFCIFCINLVSFLRFGVLYQGKFGNPVLDVAWNKYFHCFFLQVY